jgi:hypothetical protein
MASKPAGGTFMRDRERQAADAVMGCNVGGSEGERPYGRNGNGQGDASGRRPQAADRHLRAAHRIRRVNGRRAPGRNPRLEETVQALSDTRKQPSTPKCGCSPRGSLSTDCIGIHGDRA